MFLYAVDMALAHAHMDAKDNYGQSSYGDAWLRAGAILHLLDLRALAGGTWDQPRSVALHNHLNPA